MYRNVLAGIVAVLMVSTCVHKLRAQSSANSLSWRTIGLRHGRKKTLPSCRSFGRTNI